MNDQRDKSNPAGTGSRNVNLAAKKGRKAAPDAAFDLWLQRGLHAMYDEVAQEPVPEEWLKLIAQDQQPPSDRQD